MAALSLVVTHYRLPTRLQVVEMASSLDGGDSPKFTIDYEEPRPYVQEYEQAARFRPGDKVWYHSAGSATPEGPFKVSSSPSAGKYILCLIEDVKVMVKKGIEIDEEHLKPV
ncbi:hypothetical protein GGR58DRAFT_481208 [Xylaria digitata]|nr:hypothetical protein GGR58DRAFT_481208 [Xylaria digitata]